MRSGATDEYLDRLDDAARHLLDHVAAMARAQGLMPYLVGGSVRDLLLDRATSDLDVVVVGDALALARAFHLAVGGEQVARLRLHEAFGTATLLFDGGPTLDLITARHERYPAPGALPVVAPGTIDDDLRRRDYTINALALRLEPDRRAALLDPLGGRDDLTRGVLRILHDASFVDDPTRILRGLRYAGRLAYHFAPRTAELCRAALAGGALGTVSPQRISHELIRILEEERAAAILDLAVGYDLLNHLPARLRWDPTAQRAFPRFDELWRVIPIPARFARWEGRFALLVAAYPPAEARAVAIRLHLPSGAILLAEQVTRLRELITATSLPSASAALGQLLDRFEPVAVLAFAAWTEDGVVRAALLHYLQWIRPIVPVLSGDTIRALGVPPGPIYREALAALRDHKRDHPSVTAEDERAFLLSWLIARGVLAGSERG